MTGSHRNDIQNALIASLSGALGDTRANEILEEHAGRLNIQLDTLDEYDAKRLIDSIREVGGLVGYAAELSLLRVQLQNKDSS